MLRPPAEKASPPSQARKENRKRPSETYRACSTTHSIDAPPPPPPPINAMLGGWALFHSDAPFSTPLTMKRHRAADDITDVPTLPERSVDEDRLPDNESSSA